MVHINDLTVNPPLSFDSAALLDGVGKRVPTASSGLFPLVLSGYLYQSVEAVELFAVSYRRC